MSEVTIDHHISRAEIRELQQLSPFELKDKLGALADEHERRTALPMLNAGRGNPNFIAPTPREAFFELGAFGLAESRADAEWDPELVGVPRKAGIADRFRTWLDARESGPGVDLLRRTLEYGVGVCGFDPDSFVWELADGVIGDHYPEPDRMLPHAEQIAHRYLLREMCGDRADAGTFDLFAVEGGTAAMCYVFESLMVNRLTRRGDKVALMVPIFTPYLEITELAEFDFERVLVNASTTTADGLHSWQFPDSEIDKLLDPDVKVLFCVNPTNPPSVRIADAALDRIAAIVRDRRPDLIIITDDVYGTFIDGFRSLMGVCPQNTITVYSYSKYFGATGWRLGVIAVDRDNVFDRALAALPEDDKQALDRRYGSLTLTPRDLRFIDRMVADSRDVALNHTAGLSLPQQVMMLLFSAYCLLDEDDHYKHAAQGLIRARLDRLLAGLGVTLFDDPDRVGYYIELDFLTVALRKYGQELVDFLTANYEPTDLLFRLAEQTGIILLNGGGFDGPEWSVRVSLANLRDEQYDQIGRSLRAIAAQYVDEWKAARVKS